MSHLHFQVPLSCSAEKNIMEEFQGFNFEQCTLEIQDNDRKKVFAFLTFPDPKSAAQALSSKNGRKLKRFPHWTLRIQGKPKAPKKRTREEDHIEKEIKKQKFAPSEPETTSTSVNPAPINSESVHLSSHYPCSSTTEPFSDEANIDTKKLLVYIRTLVPNACILKDNLLEQLQGARKTLLLKDEELKEESSAPHVLQFCDLHEKPGQITRFRNELYVSKEYVSMFEYVWNKRNSNKSRDILIIGTPGTGKTSFGFYVMYRLAAKGIIFMYEENENEISLFVEDYVIMLSRFQMHQICIHKDFYQKIVYLGDLITSDCEPASTIGIIGVFASLHQILNDTRITGKEGKLDGFI